MLSAREGRVLRLTPSPHLGCHIRPTSRLLSEARRAGGSSLASIPENLEGSSLRGLRAYGVEELRV